jgi:sugar lactone lactonase YvrE
VGEPRTLHTGIGLGESPRWHDGRLWFCDWPAGEVLAATPDGDVEVVERIEAFPFSIDWDRDGRLLIVDGSGGVLRRRSGDGALSPFADLRGIDPEFPWNELVVAPDGTAYVNGIGYAMGGPDPEEGRIASVTADGQVRLRAGGLAFPNGMAVTPDGRTLLVGESHRGCLTAFTIGDDGDLSDRRTWAAVEGSAPDGICLDADGACWYADVPNQRCVRVAEGGAVRDVVPVPGRGCFACMLGGDDGRTLFVLAAEWSDTGFDPAARTGVLLAVDVEVPHAGHP